MGLSYRKRINLIPGVRLNLSKRGVGLGIGPRGEGVTLSPGRKPRAHVTRGGFTWSWLLFGKKR